MTLPGNKNHVGILDKYILFSDNVMIRTMKCLFETNYESEHNPPNQPSIQSVPYPLHYSLPSPTNHVTPFLTQPITHSPQEVTSTSKCPPTQPSNPQQLHPALNPPINSPIPSLTQSITTSLLY